VIRTIPWASTSPAAARIERDAGPAAVLREQRANLPARIAAAGTGILFVVAPFERLTPFAELPGQRITNVEAIVFAVIAVWAAALVWTGTEPLLPRDIGRPWLAMIGALGVSAALAPADRMNAVHLVARLGTGLALASLAAHAAARRSLTPIVWCAVAGGTVVSLLIAGEYYGVPGIRAMLGTFHTGTATVGALVRASGPLQYPTIASMYLEIVFALGVGGLVGAVAAGRRGIAFTAFAVLVLVAEGVILTFTRAGLATLATTLIVAAAFVARTRQPRPVLVTIVALALALAALLGLSRSGDALRLRMTSEGQEGWYRAAFTGPPLVQLRPRERAVVSVQVRNDGRVTWDSDDDPPFYLSYHWLELETERVVSFEGIRTRFDEPVGPGATATVPARLQAPPQPGRYRLAWDIVQEDRLWFSTEPGAELATVEAVVSGAPAGPAMPGQVYPARAVRPGRAILWRAALRMLAARPLFGVGPDNFRLQYGAYAGLSRPDRRVHSNNLYLELLAGGGLIGGGASLWFLWRATRVAVVDRLRAGARSPFALGIAAAWIAVLLHGLVDSFLSFTAIYVVTSLTLGLAAARDERADSERQA
jgi:O-antigen ligase/polysaccharide polymerase Wzy-like membrane protein